MKGDPGTHFLGYGLFIFNPEWDICVHPVTGTKEDYKSLQWEWPIFYTIEANKVVLNIISEEAAGKK